MNNCSCSIEASEGEPCSFLNIKYIRARKKHNCCECKKIIQPKEQYERLSGCWEGGFGTYKTCMDCVSIRKAFFCTFVFESLYEYLREEIRETDGDLSQDCIAMLTPKAKEKVLKMIDEYIVEMKGE